MKPALLKPRGRIMLHVIFPAALTIALFAGSLFFYTLPRVREILYDDHKKFIKEMMDIVYSLAENYEFRVQTGELTRAEAQYRFMERVRAIRYGSGGKDYFWINDLNARLIMHPYRPDMEGPDLSDYQDIKGKRFFLEFNQIAKEQGSGYVEYMWQWQDDPNHVMPKLSYVKLFEPWGWVLGTGIYVDEALGEINQLTMNVQRNTAIIFMIVACLCGYLSWQGIQTELRRRTAEKELTNSFERFKRVLDSLEAIVVVSDIATHEILFVNRRGVEMSPAAGRFGRPIADGVPRSLGLGTELRESNGADESAVQVREYYEAASGRWYENREQRIRWVDGREVCLEVAADITDRKQSEQEREGLMRKLSLKNEELQSIVYAASHDLRSPLINIHGFSKELGNSCGRLMQQLRQAECSAADPAAVQAILDEEIPESLSFIHRNTEKMQTLVSGLLQLSRIGTSKLEMQRLDMNAMLADIAAACSYQIKSLGAELSVESLPEGYGDSRQINQVFTNLIDNGLKYRQEGRPLKITVSGRELEGKVEYAVADNGIGIAKMHVGRIFELFHQLKPSGNPSEGVGLGLTIVKRILDMHNGSIRVESEPGVGSTFYVTLPKGR